MTTLLLLLLLGAALLYWVDTLRARERAQRAAEAACQQRGLQLLDQTVERTAMRLRRGPDGWLKLERHYRFDFSLDGVHRSIAIIRLFGLRVESVELSFADMPLDPTPPPAPDPPRQPPRPLQRPTRPAVTIEQDRSADGESQRRWLPPGWQVIDGDRDRR